MAEIINFSGNTFADCDATTILEQAKDWEMKKCVVIGFDEDSNLKCGGTTCELGQILELLELAKKFVVDNRIMRKI